MGEILGISVVNQAPGLSSEGTGSIAGLLPQQNSSYEK